MYLTTRLRDFGTRDGAALKPRHTSSMQKYREKSGWNKEKTPEFWSEDEKKCLSYKNIGVLGRKNITK